MKPIVLELTTQEAEALAGFIDAGLKSPQGGVQVITQAHALFSKLTAAVKAAQEPPKE